MKRKTKIILGIVDIILVSLSSAIGFGLLSSGEYSRTMRFVFGFVLMIASTITVLTVISLLRKEE